MLAACFLAVIKTGGIAVGTMPLLRAKELTTIVDKAQISHALCDARLSGELEQARAQCPTLRTVVHLNAVSYTQLPLPSNREGLIEVVTVAINKK